MNVIAISSDSIEFKPVSFSYFETEMLYKFYPIFF